MPAKLVDVAQKANVSISTVSRVLNGKDRVSEKTRKKVNEAIRLLQFYPNDMARNLRFNNAKIIAVVVPDLSNHFYSSVTKGIESIAQQNGYSVIVCNTDQHIETEKQYTQMLLQKHVSGMVIAPVGDVDVFYPQYLSNDIPVAFFDNSPDTDSPFDFVSIDNVKASCSLVEHLIELGHKNIAMLTGSQQETSARERFEGWKAALKKHNLPVIEDNIGIGTFTINSGKELMQRILKREEKPTAVFAANNFLAYGAIQAISETGLRIPDDIAIACFDAIDQTGLIKPQITTAIQPAETIGTVACRLIIDKIERPEANAFQKIILDSQLLIKESTVK